MSRIDRRRVLTSLAGGAAVAGFTDTISKEAFAAPEVGRVSRTSRAQLLLGARAAARSDAHATRYRFLVYVVGRRSL